jgi:MraZ protein
MPTESTSGTIYSGEFPRTMDAKNRVTIPSEWLKEDKVFFVLPANGRLSVMPPAVLARQEETINDLIPAGAQRHAMIRRIYSSARQVEPDKQGRILLPDEYCKKVELTTDVAFVAAKDKFEIWSAAKWETTKQQEPELSEEQRKVMEALGLE